MSTSRSPLRALSLVVVALAGAAHFAQAQTVLAQSRFGARSGQVKSPTLPASSPAFTFTFGLIDYPRQPDSAAYGINKAGWIVGGYGAGLPVNTFGDHGFILKGNTFTKIDYPGAAWTELDGINDAGVIVGVYGADYVDIHGFQLSGATMTPIDYPGAQATLPLAINKAGEIVGFRFDTPSSLYGRGFLLSKGVYTSIDYPGAIGTTASGINAAGEIVGIYYDAGANQHAYLLSGGVYTTIDFPGATATIGAGINDNGLITGGYANGAAGHGFVYQGGQFTTMDVPFGPPASTQPAGISNKNVAVGLYIDNSGTYYGYQVTVAP